MKKTKDILFILYIILGILLMLLEYNRVQVKFASVRTLM